MVKNVLDVFRKRARGDSRSLATRLHMALIILVVGKRPVMVNTDLANCGPIRVVPGSLISGCKFNAE